MSTKLISLLRAVFWIGVVCFIFLFYSNYNRMKENVITLTNNVATLKENSERLYEANQSLHKNVEKLFEIKKLETEQLSQLNKRLDNLQITWYKYAQELKFLEKDQDVKSFMDSIVPDPVASLLNDYQSKIR